MKEIIEELTLTNKIEEIGKLEPFTEQIGERLSLAPDLVFNLNLVLEEAVSNVINYAYPHQEGKEINIQASLMKDNLIFVITDSGVAFDPTLVPEADITLSAEERPIGGLGIFIIKQIMNEVNYQRIDGKNVFTLKKFINK